MSTLRLALEKIDLLPPTRVTDDTSILTLKSFIFEPLLRWENGVAQPGLLDRWEHADCGRRWRFRVRPGATFHDGEPCTAEHVAAFIDGILGSLDTFGMPWSYNRYLAHARIRAESRDALSVENPEPFADVLDVFTEFHLCRLDADGVPRLGTGPYEVAAFAPRRLRLARVTGSGPDAIIAEAEPRAEERYARLRAGAVDAALGLDHAESPLPRDDALHWTEHATTLSVIFYLNCASGVFAHPDARRAANHAVDKRALIAEALHGLGIPAATAVSPFHLGMRGSTLAPLAHDPALARRLLDDVGGSRDIVLRTPTRMPEHAPVISRFVAQALEAVGFRVAVEVEPDRPAYARQVGAKAMGDLALFDSSPASTYRVLDDKVSSRSRGVWWQGYHDDEAQALIEAANRAVETPEREAAYARCLAQLNADPPWLYLFHPVSVLAATRPGLALDARGILRLA